MANNPTISFTTIGIARSDGKPLEEVKVSRCNQCRGLVLDADEDRQAHADWHGSLRREVGMAGIGFGGIGAVLGGPNL